MDTSTFWGPEGPIPVFTVSLFMMSEYLGNGFSDIKGCKGSLVCKEVLSGIHPGSARVRASFLFHHTEHPSSN